MCSLVSSGWVREPPIARHWLEGVPSSQRTRQSCPTPGWSLVNFLPRRADQKETPASTENTHARTSHTLPKSDDALPDPEKLSTAPTLAEDRRSPSCYVHFPPCTQHAECSWFSPQSFSDCALWPLRYGDESHPIPRHLRQFPVLSRTAVRLTGAILSALDKAAPNLGPAPVNFSANRKV